MRKTSRFALISLAIAAQLAGCDSITGSSLQVEELPEVTPSLPAVPRLPPPPYPITYEDGSHSVYGARQKARKAGDGAVEVTGYIVQVYRPPACDRGESCPRPAAPHIFLGDAPDAPERDRMLVVGYAMNQGEIDAAVRQGVRGAQRIRTQGAVPIPIDFKEGNRVRVKGNVTVMSNHGFSSSNGLLEYTDHDTLEIGE